MTYETSRPAPPPKPPKPATASFAGEQAWITMYCAAISTGRYDRESAGEIADHGLINLRDINRRLKGRRTETQNPEDNIE